MKSQLAAMLVCALIAPRVYADPHAAPAAPATDETPPPDHVMLGDEPAPNDDSHDAHGAPHVHHHKLNLGVTGTVLGAFIDHEAFVAGGAGVFVEIPIVHRHLELELAVHALATEGGVEISQDLLAKIPIHVNHWFNPYVGFGPTVAEYIVAGEEHGAPRRHGWGIGGAVSVGAHFWINNRVGVVAELDYNLLYRWLTAEHVTRGALVNELGFAGGVIIGL